MKGFYYRFIGHLFPILFVVSQVFFSTNTYELFSRTVESSMGNEFISIAEKERSVEEKKIEEEKVDDTTAEESSEVIVDSVVPHVEATNLEERQEPAPVIQNSISIDSIYYNPLMHDDGSYYYLDHNLYGAYDGIGVPFIDSRMDFTTRKTILYAHSSKQGNGPFQILQNYMNSSFYYQHPIITIQYNGNTYRYQIFSVYVSLADDDYSEGLEYFNRTIYSDSRWDETIHQYKYNSIYDTGVDVSGYDKIIILQTCSMDDRYYERYYRYNLLVMGKLI